MGVSVDNPEGETQKEGDHDWNDDGEDDEGQVKMYKETWNQ